MKRVLKRLGKFLGGFVIILLLAAAGVYAYTSYRIGRNYEAHVDTVAIPTDAGSVARGRHLVESVGKCQVCHGDNYAGKVVFDEPVFASLTSSNITAGKGGIGNSYTEEDWVRSIRYGIGPNAKSLLFMPSEAFWYFNDRDLGAIIAYLRTLPPADLPVQQKKMVGPVGRMVYLLTDFPLVPAELVPRGIPRPAAVPEAVTKEYGEYLAKTGGCTSCHGASLSGGGEVDKVKVPNLTPAGDIGKWTEADFVKSIRNGTRPDGRVLSAVMPWPYMKGLTDAELRAMWLYIQGVKAKPTGEK